MCDSCHSIFIGSPLAVPSEHRALSLALICACWTLSPVCGELLSVSAHRLLD